MNNCLYGDKDIWICKTCKNNYYLDYKDGKCKSNQEDNNFKYCSIVDNNICLGCSFGSISEKIINVQKLNIVLNQVMEFVYHA